MGWIANHRIFGQYTRSLAITSGILALSSANFGFDNQGFATTQAMPYFARQFGDRNPRTGRYALPTGFLAQLNSLVFIGFVVGTIIGGRISERYGRRMTIFTMSIWALCTAVICTTAKTKGQILAGRILNYIYIGMELSTVPMYQGEIVPAPIRGFAVATYQMCIIFGGVIINAVCRGTSTIPSNLSWQIPYSLFVVIPSIVASTIWFCPESPRWLLSRGREEEARRNLVRLKAGAVGFDLENEVANIKHALEISKNSGSWMELVQRKNIKRTMIPVGCKFFLQSTGQAFTSKYGAVFVAGLGTINTFNFALISSCLGTLACLGCMLSTDRIGRRNILIAGAIAQTVVLVTMGGLGVESPTPRGKSLGIVTCVILFSFSFNASWGPATYVVIGEVPSQRLRDKTIIVANVVNVLVTFVVAYTIPYMLDALNSKVGFIFAGFAAMAVVFSFFCVPECAGRTLEDIDELFARGVPLRKFGSTAIDKDAEMSPATSPADKLEKEEGEQYESVDNVRRSVL